MIEFKNGNILAANAEALVNTVNCVGVMGRGIALQFKNVFPENFKAYLAACKRDEISPGKMLVFETGALTADVKIRWLLKDHQNNDRDYALFGLPLLLAVVACRCCLLLLLAVVACC